MMDSRGATNQVEAQVRPQGNPEMLAQRFKEVRARSLDYCRTLSGEDMVVQSMPDVSPTKWHLGHTSWFFETFILQAFSPERPPLHPAFPILFNSYYQSVGDQHPRPTRGLLTRPPLTEVLNYRSAVEEELLGLLEQGKLSDTLLGVLEIGLNHEEQHQELLLTDIKHVLGTQPLQPAWREPPAAAEPGLQRAPACSATDYKNFPEQLHSVGHQSPSFAYDNEGPVHRRLQLAFALGRRLVSCGDYLEFIEAGGYQTPGPWLSDGWAAVCAKGWTAPLYWAEARNGDRSIYTLHGRRALDLSEPVTHLSYYEADAFARWAGARLATEFEWELAARAQHPALPTKVQVLPGHFADSGLIHPQPAPAFSAAAPELAPELRPDALISQLYGDCWEWTASAYSPYPGYRAVDGALGEYNGKFMVDQQVLRGGSCATSGPQHLRPSYRNFFPASARWQFTGLRLARL